MHVAVRLSGVLAAGAAALACPSTSVAQQQPMGLAEARILYEAGGFPISADGQHPLNSCGEAAQPAITFLDLNSDRRQDALFTDRGPCYGEDVRWFSMAVKEADGSWRGIGGFPGTGDAVAVSPAGWLVIDWTSQGQTRRLEYDGSAYVVAGALARAEAAMDAAGVLAAAEAAQEAAGAPTASAAGRSANDYEEAIFRAAGFTRSADGWESGNCPAPHELSYSPGSIERQGDFNSDGRPDAIVIESGAICYGMTGQASWLVSQQADGSWKALHSDVAMFDFLDSTGPDGWPDLVLGGPGFCFPVLRWNGSAYQRIGFAYDGEPCTPSVP